MNIGNEEFETKAFSIKLMDAIQDPRKWSDVLDSIMHMTGIKAAIITLRDKQNCQIVNDVELEQKFHSPLIRGFSTEAIVHYLTNLRTIDPWAEFQRTNYPYRPVQMSRVCPQDSVPDRRFLDWLEDVGFQDTIVFELDRMSGYWTAINLFLETPTAPEAQRAMQFANEYYDLIRNAWVASQNLATTRQSSSALLDRAAGAGSPICIVGANGELKDCNGLFLEVIETDAIRLSGSNRKLSFGRSVTVFGLDRWEQHDFLKHDTDATSLMLLASPIDPDPMFAEKRENLWLLTCANRRTTDVAARRDTGIDLDALTRQERELYDAIANGRSVEQAGAAIRLKRSRTFEVWSSVKDKLGITSAHQLRT